MTVTFLVAVNIDDVAQLTSEAQDIEDDLVSAGHDVQSVQPWNRPVTAPNLADVLPTDTNINIQL